MRGGAPHSDARARSQARSGRPTAQRAKWVMMGMTNSHSKMLVCACDGGREGARVEGGDEKGRARELQESG